MTTQPRERDEQRARERPVVAERHRRRERARRAPRRPTCRRDRERGRGDRPGGTPARLQGGSEFRVAPEWVERRTSTKLDPVLTSSETARIRDRERTGSSAGRTRSRCHASAFFAAAETARNVPRLLQSTGASAEPICRTLHRPAHRLRGREPAPVGSGAGTQSGSPSWSPSRRRTSQVGDPHAHVIAAKKAGHDVGRDQVARLMAMSGIWGDERRRGVTTRETPWCRRRP